MCFGTFDHLHPGHLDYFRQARRFGALDKPGTSEGLIIVVARDKNVFRIKNHQPDETEKIRAKNIRTRLKALGWPAKVVLGSLKNQWLVLKKYRPTIICLGYDQPVDWDKLKSEIAGFRLFCKIKRLRAYQPEKYKSSYFRTGQTKHK